MKLFIIPGFTESISDPAYKKLIFHAKKIGFDVVGVRIDWAHHTMKDYVEQFVSEHGEDVKSSIVFGFSFGAMIACITAGQLKPRRVILGSLSPYFSEDLSKLRSSWKKMVGKNRLKVFRSFRFKDVIKKVDCDIDAFVGSKECDLVKKRTDALRQYPDGAKHSMGNSVYAETIAKHLASLQGVHRHDAAIPSADLILDTQSS